MPISREVLREEALTSPSASVLFIVGPTAVGKSALALQLARAFDGEVVNADSRQVYRLMDIGTAKLSPEDRARVPHHLVDILDPDQQFSLARFLKLAQQTIQDVHGRGKLPIVVGGTGQYIWALVEGWKPPHVRPNAQLRRELEATAQRDGVDTLYQRLRSLDPGSASRIDPHNSRRIIRALEIHQATGVRPSQVRIKKPPAYHPLVIGLTMTREALYRKIDRRVDEMFGKGLVTEVEGLLVRGYSQALPCMSSMGYGEVVLHLGGEYTLEEASRRTKYRTHRFARQQYTWFRLKDPRIHWVEAGPQANLEAETLVESFLGKARAVVK